MDPQDAPPPPAPAAFDKHRTVSRPRQTPFQPCIDWVGRHHFESIAVGSMTDDQPAKLVNMRRERPFDGGTRRITDGPVIQRSHRLDQIVVLIISAIAASQGST